MTRVSPPTVTLLCVAEAFDAWGGAMHYEPCSPPVQMRPASTDDMFAEVAHITCTVCTAEVKVGRLKPRLARIERLKRLPRGVVLVGLAVGLVVLTVNFFVKAVLSTVAGESFLSLCVALVSLLAAACCGYFAYSVYLSPRSYTYRMVEALPGRGRAHAHEFNVGGRDTRQCSL